MKRWQHTNAGAVNGKNDSQVHNTVTKSLPNQLRNWRGINNKQLKCLQTNARSSDIPAAQISQDTPHCERGWGEKRKGKKSNNNNNKSRSSFFYNLIYITVNDLSNLWSRQRWSDGCKVTDFHSAWTGLQTGVELSCQHLNIKEIKPASPYISPSSMWNRQSATATATCVSHPQNAQD